jgi:hypothetical protein
MEAWVREEAKDLAPVPESATGCGVETPRQSQGPASTVAAGPNCFPPKEAVRGSRGNASL